MQEQKRNPGESDETTNAAKGRKEHNPFKDKDGRNIKEPAEDEAETEQQRKDALTERD